KHQVLDWVSNEAPQWLQVVGDSTPELICTRDGFFGYATIDASKPLEAWTFHPVSAQMADKRFGHGLGAGDVNGDGRIDLIHAGGWLEQPPTLDDTKPWRQHDAKFSTAYGGAEMFAYDVDGDGDNDVITSLAAHDYGLAWYEQQEEGGERTFQRHDILGKKPEDNRYGVVFTELHSVQLADVDGDGLKDIVTGKTYYSHHKGSPMWDAGAVVYWFRLVRGPEGIDWVPYLAAEETGIGRQIALGDLQGDGLIDIAVGGMKGMHLLHHRRQEVDRDAWGAFQPVAYVAPEKPESKVGGRLEGESMKLLQVTGGDAKEQPMGGFSADHWSNDSQLWWTGAKPGDRLELELPVTEAGSYEVRTALTKARDYAIVQVLLDGKKLGEPIDLYHAPEVISTGNIRLGEVELTEGNHLLAFEIVGKHPDAVPGYMLGIDMVQLGKGSGQLPRDASGKSLNFDFEKGTLEDWVADGKAFEGQPVQGDAVAARRPDMRSEHQGKYWVGSYEIQGDAPQGTLRSVPFEVTHPFASFSSEVVRGWKLGWN
ncbi:MAG: FG-GAP-like repeat-containing protein, partial [Pirellulaceae bacterium]